MAKVKVKIFREGEHIDTQEVEAETEGKACARAMIKTKCHFRGELVSYEVVWEWEIKKDGSATCPNCEDGIGSLMIAGQDSEYDYEAWKCFGCESTWETRQATKVEYRET